MLSADTLPWSRHLSGASGWHRTDPRIRLLASLVLSVLALSSRSCGEFVLIYLVLVLLYRFSGTGPGTALRGLRPFFVLIAFTAALQLFLSPGTPLPFSPPPPLSLTREGLLLTAVIVSRLVAVILVSANLIATTSPLELSRSLGWTLLPFRRLGLPVADFMLVINLGFQFFPLLLEESQGLRLALESRGISLRHPRVAMRLRALGAWILAILSSVLERSHRQATALEVKNFGGVRSLRLRFPPWSTESRNLLLAFPALVVIWLIMHHWGPAAALPMP